MKTGLRVALCHNADMEDQLLTVGEAYPIREETDAYFMVIDNFGNEHTFGMNTYHQWLRLYEFHQLEATVVDRLGLIFPVDGFTKSVPNYTETKGAKLSVLGGYIARNANTRHGRLYVSLHAELGTVPFVVPYDSALIRLTPKEA